MFMRAGAGHACVGIRSQNKRPAPCPSDFFASYPDLITSLPYFAIPFPKTKTGLSKDHKVIPIVAGCTTGSLCPRCPY
jgi:hypothetical protein